MALDQIPPWISVQPTDYLHAVQAGGSAGLGIAEAQNRAREAAARRDDAARSAAQQQWEFGERMRQAAEEHASNRDLDAAKLAQAAKYQEGMLGYHQGQLGETSAHNQAMEEISADKAAQMLLHGDAQIVEHPEAPGLKFLRNPSGAESVIERPEKALTDAQKATFALKAFNAFKPLSSDEDVEGSLYNARTNYAGGLLKSMGALPQQQFSPSAWSGMNIPEIGHPPLPNEGTLNNLDLTEPNTEQQAGIPEVTSKAEFDALPRGAIYINKGKSYKKP